jgi:phosphoglycolate phosphatase
MINKYKHVIWDWNGTMFNDVELCVNVGNNLFRRKNVPQMSLEKYRSIFTIPVKDYYIAAGFDFEKESFEIIGKEWMDEYEVRKFECSLHSDLIPFMEKLKESGIKQSVLSAYKQDNLEKILSHFELNEYLEHIVGLDNIYAASKLELGKNLIRTIGAEKGETLLIGDTVHDYDVAAEIGSDCILIANGHQTFDTLSKTGTKVYNSINEFRLTELI